MPGLVDFEGEYVHELTNVRGWIDIPLRDALSDACGLPAAVDNDANCMVFAEARHGAARGLANVVGVTLGTGIGGGIVLGGEIYRGSHCGAGEIGQMCIDHDGRPGHYGNPGAIEEYLGNGPIAEIAIERYRAAGIARDPAEWNAANAPRLLAEAAESGCPVALALWDEFAGWLAAMFGGVAWLLDPDAIVIGGGVAKAGDLLFKPLRDKMLPTLSPTLREHLRVVPAQFSNDAGMIGAAALGVWASRRAGD
ncbi:MAG: ROK family protein [Verrucomicrobiales bacterium]